GAPAGAAGGHVPAVLRGRLYPDHLGAEPDVAAQVEVVGVALQIGQDLAVVWVVGPGVRHREVGDLGGRPGGDRVRRGVDRTAVVAPVPRPTDPGLPLVAVHREPVLEQVLGREQAAGAGPDHADALTLVVEVAL